MIIGNLESDVRVHLSWALTPARAQRKEDLMGEVEEGRGRFLDEQTKMEIVRPWRSELLCLLSGYTLLSWGIGSGIPHPRAIAI